MKNIAVGIDFDESNQRIVETCEELAKALGCELHLVHAFSPDPDYRGFGLYAYAYPGPDEYEAELRHEKEQLRKVVDRLKQKGLAAKGFMKPGESVHSILEFAEKHEADMIVVGSHSRNRLSRLLMGSVAEGVLHGSKVPVIVVPNKIAEES